MDYTKQNLGIERKKNSATERREYLSMAGYKKYFKTTRPNIMSIKKKRIKNNFNFRESNDFIDNNSHRTFE